MDNKRIYEIVEEEMIKQDANRCRDMRKTLTIPKSVADELDLHKINWQDGDLVFRVCNSLPSKIENWFDSNDNANIAIAYLAGKALGVDLVKVVEND